MLGDSLLVVPVLEEGKRDVDAFFPGNERWYQFEQREKDYFQTSAVVPAPEDGDVPVFIRGGKIIVIRDRIRRSSTLTENDPVTLVIALNSRRSAKGKQYYDDGITHDYQNGEFALKQMLFEDNDLVIKDDQSTGSYSNPKAIIEKQHQGHLNMRIDQEKLSQC